MQSPTPSSNLAIYKSNALALTPMGMSATEARVFAWALSHLIFYYPNATGKEQLAQEIVKTHFLVPLYRAMPYASSGYNHELLRQACIELYQKSVNLLAVDADSRELSMSRIVSDIRVDYVKSAVSGNFAPAILPTLFMLHRDIASVVDVQILMQLKTTQAHRLFWALQHQQPEQEHQFSVAELREVFFGERRDTMYPLFFDFKRFVLEPALNELRDLGWLVSYGEIKQGRKVAALAFHLPPLPATPMDAQP